MTKILVSLSVGWVLFVSACGPNERIMNSAQESRESASSAQNSNLGPAPSSFERDITAMRNADFKFVYVLRRRDGGILDSVDKSFITETSPEEMNRRTLSDEGKAVIIGSNFRMPQASIDALKKQLAFEDHTPAEFREAENSNQK